MYQQLYQQMALIWGYTICHSFTRRPPKRLLYKGF